MRLAPRPAIRSTHHRQRPATSDEAANTPEHAVVRHPVVVYVVSRYPAISHSFVQREIAALRDLGVTIHTVSLRVSRPEDVQSPADRVDYADTLAVRPLSARRLLGAHLHALATQPYRYGAAAVSALRGRYGVRERVRRLGHFAQAAVVWQHCTRLGVTHIHAHFERPAGDVARLAARLGRSDGVSWTWSFTAHSPQQYRTDALGLAKKVTEAAFVACVSYHGRRQLMDLVPENQWPKLHIVRCGVDTTVYRRITVRPSSVSPRVLTVARLVPGKGHAVLLDAMHQLQLWGLPLHAVWVGDGPEQERLQARANTLGLASFVTFLGPVGQDRMREVYEDADAFCLPSFSEGVPVSVMEAMAMELPVVASDIDGVPELVTHGITGRLVLPGDPTALATALRETLGDTPAQRTAMGAAARQRVARDFRCDRSASILLELLSATITQHGAPR